MKHFPFLLIGLLAISFFHLNAQDTLKNFNNKWATELNINPLNGSVSLNNANGQIKLRKFLPNNTAYRLAFTVNYKQDNTKTDSPYGTYPVHNKGKKSSMAFLINVGQEKHFSGSKRISPYVGYEIGFGAKFSKSFLKTATGEQTVKGSWDINSNVERGFWSLGANVLTGIDFYLVRNFYVGCEVTFGLDYMNYSNIKVDDTINDRTYPDYDDVSWKLGPKVLNGFRIGYIF